MHKTSFLFLLLLCAAALIGTYQELALPYFSFNLFIARVSFLLICVSLIIGPLAVLHANPFAQLIEPRRAVGIAAFVFAAIHALISASSIFNWNIGAMIALPSMLVALPAAIALLALALTSCDWAVAKMGLAHWKTLQRIIYPAFVLLFLHFALVAFNAKRWDFAEIALLLLGIATVALQLAGFYVFRKRKASIAAAEKAKASAVSTDKSAEKTP